MRTLLPIGFLIMCGCTHHVQTARDETHEVHQAALAFMLSRSATKSAKLEYSAFVVPKEYARHFSNIRPPVVPHDEKRYSTDTGLAIDRVTGKPVMIWAVSQAKISGETATCYVMWVVGNLGAGGHTVSLRKSRGSWVAEREEMLWISQAPNKAPEPTPTSVTLRATSLVTESKRRTETPNQARSAPAAVVAHL